MRLGRFLHSHRGICPCHFLVPIKSGLQDFTERILALQISEQEAIRIRHFHNKASKAIFCSWDAFWRFLFNLRCLFPNICIKEQMTFSSNHKIFFCYPYLVLLKYCHPYFIEAHSEFVHWPHPGHLIYFLFLLSTNRTRRFLILNLVSISLQ